MLWSPVEVRIGASAPKERFIILASPRDLFLENIANPDCITPNRMNFLFDYRLTHTPLLRGIGFLSCEIDNDVYYLR